jgi:hypothetical protein
MKSRFLLAAALAAFATTSFAGPVEKACNRSDRKAANRSLCGCIQSAADQTLSNADQRRAATFFKNPEKAHKTWMSQSRADDAFWDRYKTFEDQAVALCSS